MGDGGKGSAPRPLGVTLEDFDAAWARIFEQKPCETGAQCVGNKCEECQPEEEKKE
jgi:hypothetical protein